MAVVPTLAGAESPVVVDFVLHKADAQVAAWIQEKFGEPLLTVPYRALGIVSDSAKPDLVGGVYFTNQVGQDDITCTVFIEEHVTVPRVAIKEVLRYPFVTLGVPRITAYIYETNTKAMVQAERFGFQPEGRKRPGRARPGSRGAILVYGLLPDECPYWSEA